MRCPAPGRTHGEVSAWFLGRFMWMYRTERGTLPQGEDLWRLAVLAATPSFEMRGPYICCNPAGIWRSRNDAPCDDNPREPLRQFDSIQSAAAQMYNMAWRGGYERAWRSGLTTWDRAAAFRTYWRTGRLPGDRLFVLRYEPELLAWARYLFGAAGGGPL